MILTMFSVGSFFIFFPFKYVDPIESLVHCYSGRAYAPNAALIFSVDGKLDQFNDEKARKLCTYGVVRDYQDFYQAPDKINYWFAPIYSQESSIAEALLASFVIFSLGAAIIETISVVFRNMFSKNKAAETRFNIGRLYLKIISFLIS